MQLKHLTYNMKKHINDVFNIFEDWPLEDLERLKSELDILIETVELDDSIEHN